LVDLIKILAALCFLCSNASLGFAQHKLKSNPEKFHVRNLFVPYAHPWYSNTSVNIGVGVSSYSGELSRPHNISTQNYLLNPYTSLGIKHRFTDYLSLRVDASYFKLYSKTKLSQFEDRNFSSYNYDYYTALVIDYWPKPYLDDRYKKWNVYVFGGIGGVHFKPKDIETNKNITGNYKRSAFILPVGIGVSYFVTDFIGIGFEASRKYTLGDYLDGISVRSSGPMKRDAYWHYGFKVNINIFNKFNYSNHLKRG